MPPLKDCAILVVSGRENVWSALRDAAGRWGWRAVSVADPDGAVAAIRENPGIRIAIIDSGLADDGAARLLDLLAAGKRSREIWKVLLYRRGVKLDKDPILEAGCNAFLPLPFTLAELRECLEQSRLRKSSTGKKGDAPGSTPRGIAGLYCGPRARILVAEDNRVNLGIMISVLERFGLSVTGVENGVQALELLRKSKFDLVLMDVQMPEMDGLEATRIFRSGKEYISGNNIPVIALTAYVTDSDRDNCLRAGMNDFIPKPVAPEQLAKFLNNWLAKGGRAGSGRILKEGSGARIHAPAAVIWDGARTLKKLLGDSRQVAEILRSFLEDTPRLITRLGKCLAGNELPEVGRLAHTIKGAAANIGALALSGAARELEQAVRSRRSRGLKQILARIGREFSVLREEIEKFLKAGRGEKNGAGGV